MLHCACFTPQCLSPLFSNCTIPYKAVHGSTTLYVDVQSCTRIYMAVLYMAAHGFTGMYIAVQGCTRLCKAVHGSTRLYMADEGCTLLIA